MLLISHAVCSALSVLALASSPEEQLVVRVRDAHGTPVEGIVLRILGFVGPACGPDTGERGTIELARATTDENGEVCIDGERLDAPLPLGFDTRVEPCIATVEDHGVALPRGPWPKEPLAITLPPLGQLEFKLPSKPNARVRLQHLSTDRDAPPRMNQRLAALDWTRDARGDAVFAHVGLGVRFEAAIWWNGLLGEHVFSCAGPTRAGEVVRVSDPRIERVLVFDGRALDDYGEPLAVEALVAHTWSACGPRFTGYEGRVLTDADGRFHVEVLALEQGPTDGQYGLRLAHPAQPTAAQFSALFPIESPTRAGPRALGDVCFALDTIERQLVTYPDDALESELCRWSAWGSRPPGTPLDWVLLLAEVVRRGCPRWERFVAELDAEHVHKRAAELRRQHEEDKDDPVAPPPAAHDRRLLTALRRLQGKPDPIVFEVLDGPVIEVRFPFVPLVHCRVRSVETTERVKLTIWCQDENVGVVLDPTGRTAGDPRHAERAAMPRLCRHAPWIDTELEPGGVVSFVVDLPDKVTLDEPGEHELAIVIDEDLRRGDDAPVTNFALRSASFRLKLTADPIRLTRATYDALRKDLTSIARDTCVKLVRAPWTTATVFVQDDLEPQDRIFRAGWSALPVLIDALDDSKVAARHQEWALGLLFDLTGLHQPAGDACSASLIGRTCWEDAWPTTRRDVVFSDDRGNGYVVPEGTTVADLKSAWKALRAKLDVVVE